MTLPELEAARALQWKKLCPPEFSLETLHDLVRDLGLANASDLEAWNAAAPALIDEALASRRLIELVLWPEGIRYIAPEWFELVYVLAGDRHPQTEYRRQAAHGRLSWLAAEIQTLLLQQGQSMTASDLRARLGSGGTSVLGVERGLHELALGLKVLRAGRVGGENLWCATACAFPGLAARVDQISAGEAAAGLLTLRLSRQMVETEPALADYFVPVISRARVHSALRGLETAGALGSLAIDGRTAVCLRIKE